MTWPVYDTREGIQLMLSSLRGLNELETARQEAGYDRKEQMNSWFILGRYHTDSVGNFGRINPPFIPKDRFPDIPDVLTGEEFWAFLKGKAPDEEFQVSSSLGNSQLPPRKLRCALCKKRWKIHNAHHTVVHHAMENWPLDEFAGKSLGFAKAQFSRRTDAIFYMQEEVTIRHKGDEFFLGREIDDSYVIRPGDEGHFNVWRYYHPSCNRKKLARDAESEFRQIFITAGFRWPKFTAIKNEYCGCPYCAPWFMVKTKQGLFQIGWRKRVINIDWTHVGKSFPGLFAHEDVTEGSTYVHAWGDDKATEYLTRIRQKLVA